MVRILVAELRKFRIGDIDLNRGDIAVVSHGSLRLRPCAATVLADLEAAASSAGIDSHVASVIKSVHAGIPARCKQLGIFPFYHDFAMRCLSGSRCTTRLDSRNAQKSGQ